ncbi:MAG: transketolase [Defluviitaleaceae bacterium]|nr:transketolase [Defluviitaleaceae bacterium]
MTDQVKLVENAAQQMRTYALEMTFNAGRSGAHVGPAMSCMEILAALYCGVLKFDVKNPAWEERDRLMISKGHCVLAYYTALVVAGFIKPEELATFEKNGTDLAGHPSMDLNRGIEYSSGSLGMAFSASVGMAISAKRAGRSHKVYTLLGDGECNEGCVWESFMAAAHYKLDNLVAIIDKNGLQLDGATKDVMDLGDMEKKLTAFGWEVSNIDGHSVSALLTAFFKIIRGKPHAIIANTIKGKGVSFMENNPEWHHGTLSQAQYETAIAEITGGVPCKS